MTRDDAYVLIGDDGKDVQATSGKFKDDVSGQILVDSLVREAQLKELDYFESKNVWEMRPRDECLKVTSKRPIIVRWVITNKGDDGDPNSRARLVARQIRHAGVDSIFAPTPPLEGVRLVLSLAATDLNGEELNCRDEKSVADAATPVGYIAGIF